MLSTQTRRKAQGFSFGQHMLRALVTGRQEGLLIPKEPEDEKEKQYHEKQVKQDNWGVTAARTIAKPGSSWNGL